MSEKRALEFKIGMVGPSRVGKTSLIASILTGGTKLLAGTQSRLHYADIGTEQRVAKTQKELAGSLFAGEFEPGAVKGTEEPFQYTMRLEAKRESVENSILFRILDFPGGWLGEGRPKSRGQDWETCTKFMRDSTVLIIPVESAVLMEATTSQAKRAVPHILEIHAVEQVVIDWIKQRLSMPHEPAMLIFCPVKCESYFNDNGGIRDSSEKLFASFEKCYSGVLKSLYAEVDASRVKLPQFEVLYIPVDTVGCVEIRSGEWSGQSGDGEQGSVFSAKYRVRDPGEQSVKAADSVFIALCRQFVALYHRELNQDVSVKIAHQNASKVLAEKDEGAFKNVMMWFTGERKERRQEADRAAINAKKAVESLKPINDLLERLQKYSLSSRVKVLR